MDQYKPTKVCPAPVGYQYNVKPVRVVGKPAEGTRAKKKSAEKVSFRTEVPIDVGPWRKTDENLVQGRSQVAYFGKISEFTRRALTQLSGKDVGKLGEVLSDLTTGIDNKINRNTDRPLLADFSVLSPVNDRVFWSCFDKLNSLRQEWALLSIGDVINMLLIDKLCDMLEKEVPTQDQLIYNTNKMEVDEEDTKPDIIQSAASGLSDVTTPATSGTYVIMPRIESSVSLASSYTQGMDIKEEPREIGYDPYLLNSVGVPEPAVDNMITDLHIKTEPGQIDYNPEHLQNEDAPLAEPEQIDCKPEHLQDISVDVPPTEPVKPAEPGMDYSTLKKMESLIEEVDDGDVSSLPQSDCDLGDSASHHPSVEEASAQTPQSGSHGNVTETLDSSDVAFSGLTAADLNWSPQVNPSPGKSGIFDTGQTSMCNTGPTTEASLAREPLDIAGMNQRDKSMETLPGRVKENVSVSMVTGIASSVVPFPTSAISSTGNNTTSIYTTQPAKPAVVSSLLSGKKYLVITKNISAQNGQSLLKTPPAGISSSSSSKQAETSNSKTKKVIYNDTGTAAKIYNVNVPSRASYPCTKCDKVFSTAEAHTSHRKFHDYHVMRNTMVPQVSTSSTQGVITRPGVVAAKQSRLASFREGIISGSRREVTPRSEREVTPGSQSKFNPGSEGRVTPESQAAVNKPSPVRPGLEIRNVKQRSWRTGNYNQDVTQGICYRKSNRNHFPCTKCKKIFISHRSLTAHLNRRHGIAPNQGPSSVGTLPTSDNSAVPAVPPKLRTGRWPCEFCNKVFTFLTRYNDHRKKHLKTYKCKQCGELIKDLFTARKHAGVHKRQERLLCEECGKYFKGRHGLKQHQLTHSSIKLHKCPECGRQFRTKNNLRNHRRMHTGDIKHVCEHCGKKYLSATALRLHIRIVHEGERPAYAFPTKRKK